MNSLDDFLSSPRQSKRRICIITSIFHGFGKIGGFGTMARTLASMLSDNDYDVVVAAPLRDGQSVVTKIDGFTVLGLSMTQLVNPRTYARIDADLYHSQSPNLMSTAAKLAKPGAKHVITCRDPRTIGDWLIEIRDATLRRKVRNLALMFFEEGPLVTSTIRRADCVAFAARFLKGKIEKMYRPRSPLVFLPNIENVPEEIPRKSANPTVCWVGRFDKRKRPEIYIEVARKFPDVRFTMVGIAEDRKWQKQLETMASSVSNLDLPGYVDKFEDSRFYDYYESSWIFVNTASREAHPLTFFEAAGRGCAILSYVNPDDFASKFGYWAAKENFEEGLSYLLSDDNWRRHGAMAHEYVKRYYSYKVASEAHLKLYEELLH